MFLSIFEANSMLLPPPGAPWEILPSPPGKKSVEAHATHKLLVKLTPSAALQLEKTI